MCAQGSVLVFFVVAIIGAIWRINCRPKMLH